MGATRMGFGNGVAARAGAGGGSQAAVHAVLARGRARVHVAPLSGACRSRARTRPQPRTAGEAARGRVLAVRASEDAEYYPPTTSEATHAAKHHAKDNVMRLLENRLPNTFLDDPQMRVAVRDLVNEDAPVRPAERSSKGELGQGVWEVFHAPHFDVLQKGTLATFDQIRYTLQGNTLSSNVRFSHPVVGEGWLSASGKFYAKDAYTLQVVFDNFWVDGVNSLHEELPLEGFSGKGALSVLGSGPLGSLTGLASTIPGASQLMQAGMPLISPALNVTATATEHIIDTACRVLFPAFSSFPVLYVSEDLAVFQFNAARTPIAVRKVADTSISIPEYSPTKTADPPPPPPAAASPPPPSPPPPPPPPPPPAAQAVQAVNTTDAAYSAAAAKAAAIDAAVAAAASAARSGATSEETLSATASQAAQAAVNAARPAAPVEAAAVPEPAANGAGAEAEAEPKAASASVPPSGNLPSWEECNMSGSWEKDERRSDSEKQLFDVMEMSWVFSQAAKLLKSVQVVQSGASFKIITAASVISISEEYPLSGDTVRQNRRDMRPGDCNGSVERVAEPVPGVALNLRFTGEISGKQREVFFLEGPQTMVRTTELRLDNGKTWSGRTYYVRK